MNHRNGCKMLSRTFKCGSYLVVFMSFMSLFISLASAFLSKEINEIDVPFTKLEQSHSNRKGRCKYLLRFCIRCVFFFIVVLFFKRTSVLFCAQIEEVLVFQRPFDSIESTKLNSINNFGYFSTFI